MCGDNMLHMDMIHRNLGFRYDSFYLAEFNANQSSNY